MQRHSIVPRNNWKKTVESQGFGFHTTNSLYWDESVYYSFSMKEVEQIEEATAALYEMCLEAVDHVISNRLFKKFGIPNFIQEHIIRSWNEDHPAIYGRFDFTFKNGTPKMLEFNADTPTSLFETGIIQWHWLQDFDKDKDQFNSVHEKLINYWEYLKQYLYKGPLYFTTVRKNLEDLTTVEYLRDCAIQAGIETKLIFLDEIGWTGQGFVDLDENPIKNVFKLYPWEWLLEEEFGQNIPNDWNRAFWIEPSWKMILSNKAILPILWELFPNHEYLLESYFEEDSFEMTDYVRKPILSREGANVEIYKNRVLLDKTSGIYNNCDCIIQELCELPEFDGHSALIGSWVIGQEPAGMGIREGGLITNNTSRFVPHLIK